MGVEGEEDGASWSFDLLAGKSMKEGVQIWPRPGWGGGSGLHPRLDLVSAEVNGQLAGLGWREDI